MSNCCAKIKKTEINCGVVLKQQQQALLPKLNLIFKEFFKKESLKDA